MFRQYYFFVVLVVILGGCAINQNLNYLQMADMKQSYTQFDMKLAWNVTTKGTETRIEGLMKNTWATPVTDVEIWVSLQDSNAKTIARKSFFVPGSLEKNEAAQFSFMLPVRAETGSKLVFTYRYNPHSGGDSDRWMQSFEADIPY